MTTNPLFNHFGEESEQDLYEDLIIEAIQAYGHDIYYMPRELVKEDLLYGEDVLSKFEDIIPIEIYIKNVEAWSGEGDFLSKFGLEIRDRGTFTMSIRRWREEVVKKDLLERISRPQEGDLIYFPLSKSLFEVTFVEHEDVFYQNGKLKVFDLTVELFEYSEEDINTGNDDIDQVEDNQGYAILLTLGAGTGTYEIGETVYQGVDLLNATSKAVVIEHNTTDSTLKVKDISGELNLTDALVGDTSTASYVISTFNDQENVNDNLEDNVVIETEADNIIDFSEDNPFSESI